MRDRAVVDPTIVGSVEAEWKCLCRLGAISALIVLVYSVLVMIELAWLGGPPGTAQECFELLQKNVVVGLLRLDVLTIVVMPVFYFFYAGLFSSLQRDALPLAALSTALAFAGLTLVLCTPSVLTMVHLSHQYAAATSEARRTLLLAAGEATMSSDMWHSTGAKTGGALLQLAGVLISIAMLRSRVFSKLTGYLGLATQGLDLAHVLIGLFAPTAGMVLMIIAGPLYLLWLPLVARRMFQLGRGA